MIDKERFQRMVDEIHRMSEADRELENYQFREQLKKEMIESDECVLNGFTVGRLSHLPDWAQAYIKSLRAHLPAPPASAPCDPRR